MKAPYSQLNSHLKNKQLKKRSQVFNKQFHNFAINIKVIGVVVFLMAILVILKPDVQSAVVVTGFVGASTGGY